MIFDWNAEKNVVLKQERGISFEEIVAAIREGGLEDIIDHLNQTKYPNQQIFCVRVHDYIYLVPFVKDEESIFLQTIIPSRKATKLYLTP